MDKEKTIPIVVGVTGHLAIRPEDRSALSAAVRKELKHIRELCPHSGVVMLTSLAAGGDLLCADAAEELGIPVAAALPRPREDYALDFDEVDRARVEAHCDRAEQVFVTPPTEALPAGGVTRDYQFRQAGIYVAAHCHVLLALWDGGPGTRAACGTAEAVDFALKGSYSPASGVSVRSDSNEAVIHVFTPRGERTGKAGAVRVLGNLEAVQDVLRKTDDFNRHAAGVEPDTASRLPDPSEPDPILRRMELIGRIAGRKSAFYAGRYRLVLALLAAASALLTFAFLLYDEIEAFWMILVCGLMLLAAWGCLRWAVRMDCHRRYIEYRALSECLRVQTYLRYAGSRVQATDLLSWTQQEETAWIMDALCALNVGPAPAVTHDIRACWVEQQREYHRRAGRRSHRDSAVSEQVVKTALTLSIALYCAAVVFELLFAGTAPRAELYRTVLKIATGSISAVTLFIANYYGRLSLPRTLSDHGKMERFYGKMLAQLEQNGQTEELLTVLAREELIENGNWCSYQRDNKPDISL